jgi:hypothetical protein
MHRPSLFISLLLLFLPALLGLPVRPIPAAAAAAAPETTLAAPIEARRITGPIHLDGRLDEPDWQRAPALDRLLEIYPGDRSAPPERTAARFLYDDRYLYIGVHNFLRDPSLLRAPFVRRDKVVSSMDYLQIYLDPAGAKRGAYLFRINARGVKTDGLQDEAKQTETLDPDFDWSVATQIGDQGWTAEFRIPLTALRVTKTGRQRWSVIVLRRTPRSQNVLFSSAPWPHDTSCWICYASPLDFADLAPAPDNLLLLPSFGIEARHDQGALGRGRHVRLHPSLDAQFLPAPGAAIDLTIKPDFSQVEADAPLLTANARFALDLPEKRPFFREGLDLVDTKLPLVKTRSVAAPDFGLRGTYRSADANATMFVARDVGRPGLIEPGLRSSDTVFPDFGSDVAFGHGKLGFGAGDAGLLVAVKRNDDGSFNRVAALDASWGDSEDRIVGQAAAAETKTPNRPDLLAAWHGQRRVGTAASLQWDHTGETLWSARYEVYAPGFRSWLGYVPRVGYQAAWFDLRRVLHPDLPPLNDIAPYLQYDQLQAIGQNGREGGFAIGALAHAVRNTIVDVALHSATRVLTEQGGERSVTYVKWTASSNPRAMLPLLQLDGTAGEMVDFATGMVVPGVTLAAALRLQPLDRLELEGRWSASRLGRGAAGPRLRETATELLATWHFAPGVYALADLQWYRTSRTVPAAVSYTSQLASLQLAWEAAADTQLYAGVRSGALHRQDPLQQGRSSEVYLKLTRQLPLRL